MFLLKAIQDKFLTNKENESVAFVIMNVKGRDLLAIDEPSDELTKADKATYNMIGMDTNPFRNVKYYYPYSKDLTSSTYARRDDIESQMKLDKAFFYKYIFEEDKESIDLLFSNIDDPNQTMESIVNHIVTGQGGFNGITNWVDLLKQVHEHTMVGHSKDKEITVLSWRKFYRLFRKTIEKSTIFQNGINKGKKETRLQGHCADGCLGHGGSQQSV